MQRRKRGREKKKIRWRSNIMTEPIHQTRTAQHGLPQLAQDLLLMVLLHRTIVPRTRQSSTGDMWIGVGTESLSSGDELWTDLLHISFLNLMVVSHRTTIYHTRHSSAITTTAGLSSTICDATFSHFCDISTQ